MNTTPTIDLEPFYEKLMEDETIPEVFPSY